ncbi:MAG: twin-arginine translocase TatA/TatE family subunit [Myxococcaceae bacterium]
MLGVGIFELLMIFVVALLVLGPDQLPKAARTLAKMLFEFRKVSEDLRLTVMGAGDIQPEILHKKIDSDGT